MLTIWFFKPNFIIPIISKEIMNINCGISSFGANQIIMHKFFYSFIFLFPFACNAQSTINASGNTKTTSSMIHDYSVGEMVLVHTASSAHLIVTQGVLQPSSSADLQPTLALQMNVYPNPSTNIVYIECMLLQPSDIKIQLLDINGKIIYAAQHNQIDGFQKMPISLESFANGNYIIHANIKSNQQQQNVSCKVQKI
jgi:Secretion system C-terminal sorting domain